MEYAYLMKSATLDDTLAAVSLLLNTESCSRVSGTAVYRRWKKDDLTGAPNSVETVEFVVDNELDSWSETHRSIGQTRRYSMDSGQDLVDVDGASIAPKPSSDFDHWPLLIKMLRPVRFGIWGRPGDKWRMAGAEPEEHGILTRFVRDESPATAELFIDSHFSLPIRWTEVHPLGPDRNQGAKREVEITAIHVPKAWKRRMGIDMSEAGAFEASFVSDEQ